jgi:precorrin-6B methylase 2
MVRQAMRVVTVVVCAALVSAPAYGQSTQKPPYEPQVGQAGKDVVWVPTPQVLVDKMLDMAEVTPRDLVIDLGSGDGRTVITAAKRGATAIGVEYNPDMVALSEFNAKQAGVTDKAKFVRGDIFEYDFSKANVLTMFLLPSINMKLRPKILDMRPGTRVVTNSFTMEDWEADASETVTDDCTSWCTAHLWIVPAKVEGSWQMPQGALTLKQQFQNVTGTLGSAQVTGKLRGAEIELMINGQKYSGTVEGNTIKGTANGQSWTATKK